jgi:hypothetical protein
MGSFWAEINNGGPFSIELKGTASVVSGNWAIIPAVLSVTIGKKKEKPFLFQMMPIIKSTQVFATRAGAGNLARNVVALSPQPVSGNEIGLYKSLEYQTVFSADITEPEDGLGQESKKSIVLISKQIFPVVRQNFGKDSFVEGEGHLGIYPEDIEVFIGKTKTIRPFQNSPIHIKKKSALTEKEFIELQDGEMYNGTDKFLGTFKNNAAYDGFYFLENGTVLQIKSPVLPMMSLQRRVAPLPDSFKLLHMPNKPDQKFTVVAYSPSKGDDGAHESVVTFGLVSDKLHCGVKPEPCVLCAETRGSMLHLKIKVLQDSLPLANSEDVVGILTKVKKEKEEDSKNNLNE